MHKLQHGWLPRNLRALRKATLGLGLIVYAYIAAKRMEKCKTDKERFAIADKVYRKTRNLLGITVEFNGVPFEQEKLTLFAGGTHISRADFLVALAGFRASFMMLKSFFDAPGIGLFSKAVGNIPAAQEKDPARKAAAKEFEQAGIIENFKVKKRNFGVFLSGTTTDGSKMALPSPGLLEIVYGQEAGGMKLESHEIPLVQPFNIEVAAINGKPAGKSSAEDSHPYNWRYYDSTVTGLWRMFQAKSMTIRLTGLDPINPKRFEIEGDARASAKALAAEIYRVTKEQAHPDQTKDYHRADIHAEWEREKAEFQARNGQRSLLARMMRLTPPKAQV